MTELDTLPVLRSAAIIVNGVPAPQGSKRAVRLGNGKIGMVESSAKVKPWRDAVHAAAAEAVKLPFTGPVQVSLLFRLPRPQGHYRTGRSSHLLRDDAPGYPAAYPDLDKLCRSTLDGLTVSKDDGRGAWHDDGQVIRISAVKHYADAAGLPAGCTITITECAPASADARLTARAAARAPEQEEKHPCSLPF